MPDLSFQGIKDALSSLLGQSKGEDAVTMLIADHRRVKEIFDTYKDMDDEEKMEAIQKALLELALHAACEEKLVYPLLREEGEEDEVDEAFEEHHVVKLLISELETMTSSSERLDAKFKVLGEIVQHHVEEEEHEMFPELRSKSDVDLHALGEQIAAKKEELLAKLGNERNLGLIDPELSIQRNGDGNGHDISNGNGRSASGRKTTRKAAPKGKATTASARNSGGKKSAAAAKKGKTGGTKAAASKSKATTKKSAGNKKAVAIKKTAKPKAKATSKTTKPAAKAIRGGKASASRSTAASKAKKPAAKKSGRGK